MNTKLGLTKNSVLTKEINYSSSLRFVKNNLKSFLECYLIFSRPVSTGGKEAERG